MEGLDESEKLSTAGTTSPMSHRVKDKPDESNLTFPCVHWIVAIVAAKALGEEVHPPKINTISTPKQQVYILDKEKPHVEIGQAILECF
jgi:hypothetical protein